jgi:hypothetical protein
MFLAVFGLAVMNLWNWLMPSLFGWKLVSFWQAVGLVILSKILFGSFRGRPARHMYWRHRMMQRWEQMSPEERDRFREGLRGGCRDFEPPTAKPGA